MLPTLYSAKLKGGPYRTPTEPKSEYIKGFLGSKDENIYILLEIIFNPSLILSPYIFLLGLLFIDHAFKRVNGEEVLTSVGPRRRASFSVDRANIIRNRAISDSLYNLIIYYADSRTFLKYYLDRRINKNLPTIIRGLNPDNDIIYIAY
ncbi:hypothetical protein N7475_007452 [Penicillium sp. IBT 31633x]|nr:hypothetical protein N7475_007452 [Penicillium sp. IBT 31633x]